MIFFIHFMLLLVPRDPFARLASVDINLLKQRCYQIGISTTSRDAIR